MAPVAVRVAQLRALGGWVEFGAAAGVLLYVLAYRVPGHKADGEGRVADRLGPLPTAELEAVGDAAAREQVEAGAGEADPRAHLADLLIAPCPRLVGGHPGDTGQLAVALEHDRDRAWSGPVGVEGEARPSVVDEHVAHPPAGRQRLDAGQQRGRGHCLGLENDHWGARLPAVLTCWRAALPEDPGGHVGAPAKQQEQDGEQRPALHSGPAQALHSSPAQRKLKPASSTVSRPPRTTAAIRPMRRRLQRWTEIREGSSGNSRRNSACRSRPW